MKLESPRTPNGWCKPLAMLIVIALVAIIINKHCVERELRDPERQLTVEEFMKGLAALNSRGELSPMEIALYEVRAREGDIAATKRLVSQFFRFGPPEKFDFWVRHGAALGEKNAIEYLMRCEAEKAGRPSQFNSEPAIGDQNRPGGVAR